jgi:hypothetical protein
LRKDLRAPLQAEVQHRTAIERDAEVLVKVQDADDLRMWALTGEAVAVTARVTAL